MALPPVSQKRINIAKEFGLSNVEQAAIACRRANLPFWAACALLQKESGGKNLWGGADASPFVELNRQKIPVNHNTFTVFEIGVLNGLVPTGVGPCQITYAGALKTRPDGSRYRDGGYFRIMRENGLRPWVPIDNMEFGFGTMRGHYDRHHSWVTAGRLYNGALSYGEDYERKCQEWADRFSIRGDIYI